MERREEEDLARLGTDDDRWDKPPSAGPDEDRGDLHRRCDDERETMTPKETAECAGTSLAEEFEGEEDGGT